MAARSSWKGYLKLSLISVPVKAYTATSSTSGIQLNQLHDECHSRIQYKKACPIHGEVANDEIVSGYQYAKGQYVVIDTSELEKLRSETDKSVNVDCFVPADAIDPVYHSGKTYYLVPDGPVGQKPYALIRESMAEKSLHAVAKVVLSNKEQLVLVRPIEDLLAMTVLDYKTQVKEPAGFKDEVVETEASPQERRLATQLLEGMVNEEFDLGAYPDLYTERLTELIQAKVEGREVVSPPAVEEPHVINLMDALKASVKQTKPTKKPAASEKKPARKKAASATSRGKKKAARRKKSG